MVGRTRPETEGLIGFFVNTLALRTGLVLSGRALFRRSHRLRDGKTAPGARRGHRPPSPARHAQAGAGGGNLQALPLGDKLAYLRERVSSLARRLGRLTGPKSLS
ncbi:MAG: hypothetical protein C4551_08875 [Bacillota bacterium]|nr:MAG: hypothetical protein C4551_08875 [Bacillota bacterium]